MLKLSNLLLNFSDKIINFANNFEKIKSKIPEIIVLLAFPLLVCFFGYFHEPWFDEAQAWQIAKCASIKDIIFYIPHFEGHPPFWHLMLSVFAKNNFPYEATIKTIACVFSYAGVCLIVLKAPFYRIIRLVLPFSYFLFYQYTIISRPYCLVMLAFCLLAIFYKTKNKHPFLYSFCLILLAIVHPFTFIISSGLALCWFIENIENKTFNKKTAGAYFLLFIFYASLIILLIPDSNAFAMNMEYKSNIYMRLLYSFIIIPANCFISSVFSELYKQSYFVYDFLLGLFIGVIVWYFIYFYTSNKKLFKTFLIPYIPFAICASKYACLWHVGIIFCFIIFICWITLDIENNKTKNKNSELIKKCFALFVVFSLFSNLYWNFKSCILDVFICYAKGKKEAEFIKENHLDKYKIMTDWYKEDCTNTGINGTWLTIAPYFNKNIFYNFNEQNPNQNYVFHKEINKEGNALAYKHWKQKGLPDVIAGSPDLSVVFGDYNYSNLYVTVYTNNTTYIQKGVPLGDEVTIIQVKKELAEKLNLKEVKTKTINYKLDSFRISFYIFCKIFDLKDKIKEKLKEN